MSFKGILILTFVILWRSRMAESSRQDHPNMILILVDGFRWDYTEIHRGDGLPGFDYMLSSGVHAKYLNPVFPANSFPNWHTIATGLYPENHGIIDNFIYNPTNDQKFDLYDLETTKNADWWKDTEPLWITATKSSVDTALFYWARCDVAWDGVLPKYCRPYSDESIEPESIIEQVNQALDMIQKEGYTLTMLYTGRVDIQGHFYGPDSPEVGVAVHEFDAVLVDLWQALESRGLKDDTDVVILSDHGMTSTLPEDAEIVDITPCIRHKQVRSVIGYGSVVNILPLPGYAREVAEALRECPSMKDKVEIHLTEELHERYHYKSHRFIHEVLLIAKPGYNIWAADDALTLPEEVPSYVGNHGFDNTLDRNPNMRGILYATGPSFAKGVESGSVEQVDVYGLLCRALQLSSCHPSDGAMDRVEDFFISSDPQDSISFMLFTFYVLLFVMSVFVMITTSIVLTGCL